MMDKPLSVFDLFYDAANPTNGGNGNAIRVPQNYETSGNNPARYAFESFYRWMVPNNNVPDTFFFNGVPPPTGAGTSYRHDVSNFGPSDNEAAAFDIFVHNTQLTPPTPDNDQKRFWPVKPFAPFHRARKLSFWSVDWKSYEDAEIVPSAPTDFTKQNLVILNYWYLFTNGWGDSVLPGNPESFYVWINPQRNLRYVDVAGSEQRRSAVPQLPRFRGEQRLWESLGGRRGYLRGRPLWALGSGSQRQWTTGHRPDLEDHEIEGGEGQ